MCGKLPTGSLGLLPSGRAPAASGSGVPHHGGSISTARAEPAKQSSSATQRDSSDESLVQTADHDTPHSPWTELAWPNAGPTAPIRATSHPATAASRSASAAAACPPSAGGGELDPGGVARDDRPRLTTNERLVSSIAPIVARPPVCSTNEHAARTFGPIEPAANSARPSASGRRAPDRALFAASPSPLYTASTSVTMASTSAPSARRAWRWRGPCRSPPRRPTSRRPAGTGSSMYIDRDAAAARADDDAVALEHPLDRLDAEDPLRQRRGDDAAHAVAVGLERPALLGRERGPRLRVERADRLGRVVEGRVVGVDLDLRQQRREPRSAGSSLPSSCWST